MRRLLAMAIGLGTIACGSDSTAPLTSVAGTWTGDVWGGTATLVLRDSQPPFLAGTATLPTHNASSAEPGALGGPHDAAFEHGTLTASFRYPTGFITIICDLDKRNRCVGSYRENGLYMTDITLTRR